MPNHPQQLWRGGWAGSAACLSTWVRFLEVCGERELTAASLPLTYPLLRAQSEESALETEAVDSAAKQGVVIQFCSYRGWSRGIQCFGAASATCHVSQHQNNVWLQKVLWNTKPGSMSILMSYACKKPLRCSCRGSFLFVCLFWITV